MTRRFVPASARRARWLASVPDGMNTAASLPSSWAQCCSNRSTSPPSRYVSWATSEARHSWSSSAAYSRGVIPLPSPERWHRPARARWRTGRAPRRRRERAESGCRADRLDEPAPGHSLHGFTPGHPSSEVRPAGTRLRGASACPQPGATCPGTCRRRIPNPESRPYPLKYRYAPRISASTTPELTTSIRVQLARDSRRCSSVIVANVRSRSCAGSGASVA